MIKAETISENHHVTLPTDLNAEAVDMFRKQMKAWLLLTVRAYVFDFELTKVITPAFYQALIQFRSSLKGTGKVLHSFHLNFDLIQQINRDGMRQIFAPLDSLNELTARSARADRSAGGIDVELINPFLKATINTLEVQAKTQVKPLKMEVKKESRNDIAITGVIPINTDTFTGSLAICFPLGVFLKIYENMFGEVHEVISKEMEDAAGELLNIIYGQAKIELNDKEGYNLKKALPTVLVGEKLRVSQQGNAPTVIINFETNFGIFHIEVGTQST